MNMSTSIQLADNPLLKQSSTPLFAEIKNEHIMPAIEHDLTKLKVDFSGNIDEYGITCIYLYLHLECF